MRALVETSVVVTTLILQCVWSIPLPGSNEDIHLTKRDLDEEDGDIEPLITTWPDLPLQTRVPQFEALVNFGDTEDDAMAYILLENENIVKETPGFMEGDIYIGPMVPRNAITNLNKRWPNAQVPYEIWGFDSAAVTRINAAIQEYHTHTCMRWVRRTTQRDYVRFVPKSGCWSPVGRTGGMQELSVGGACNWSRGVIMHEMMHAAGFHHEQTRLDRDNYVTIYWQNIQRGLEFNFQKYALDTQGTSYDYASIMHYPRNAFSSNGYDTIVPKQSVSIGNRNAFSQTDIRELNKLYECSGGGGGGGEEGGDCADKENDCGYWATTGYCTSGQYVDWMKENCPKSCNSCDDTDDGGGGGGGDCKDDNNQCSNWAQSGECQANPGYMLVSCKKSCDQCDGGANCEDKNVNCEWWSGQGFCRGTHARYMSRNCKKSCNTCGSAPSDDIVCIDRNDHCAIWAWMEECKENPDYMLESCPRSCAQC
ncbi:zinc metalloproteinase nas-4-like isoform X2 [Ptychodera flava]|uniref:zinc metalloproteinase nas-4-like isoform X2 n=1 Tax=Ptychodera flava TaxID=63121 RepID=UPI003969BB51